MVGSLEGTSKNLTERKWWRKITCNSLITSLTSGKKITLGTLKTSKARF
jgi:hypothetical protein